jgi:hypothetical protein
VGNVAFNCVILWFLEHWLKRWRIQADGTKSTLVTFTLKREDVLLSY